MEEEVFLGAGMAPWVKSTVVWGSSGGCSQEPVHFCGRWSLCCALGPCLTDVRQADSLIRKTLNYILCKMGRGMVL